LYYASFQVNAAGGSGTTVLTVKDELIRMITVASASEIPKERIEAAARNDIVDGVRTTILKGKVTVTVATLEQHDEWVSLLLAEDGGLRQAFLRNTVEGTFPRPPPAVSKDWIEALSISQMMGISPRDHRPLIREVYIVGEVLALHTPTLLHESRSSINIVDLDLRLPEYDRFKYVNALAKYIEDSRRYKHRYDPHYSDTREEGGYGSEGGKGTDDSLPKDHPMESHPIEAVP
jgi:hypothetical protein